MPTVCSRVLSLPPRLAGITPCRMTKNRSSVTPISRTSTTTVTHQGSSPRSDRPISAAPISALSAIGSAILPKSVTSPRRRASSPSTRSVTAATANTTNASTRHSGSSPSPWNSRTRKTGTSSSRSTVSAFAMFQALTEATGVSLIRRSLTVRHQVGTLAGDHGRGDQCTHGEAGAADQPGAAVDLGTLVGGPALDGAGDGVDLLDQHLRRSRRPVPRHAAPPARRPAGSPGRPGRATTSSSSWPSRVAASVPSSSSSRTPRRRRGGHRPGTARARRRRPRSPRGSPRSRWTGCRRSVPPPGWSSELEEALGVTEPAHPAQHRAAGVLERQVEVRQRHPASRSSPRSGRAASRPAADSSPGPARCRRPRPGPAAATRAAAGRRGPCRTTWSSRSPGPARGRPARPASAASSRTSCGRRETNEPRKVGIAQNVQRRSQPDGQLQRARWDRRPAASAPVAARTRARRRPAGPGGRAGAAGRGRPARAAAAVAGREGTCGTCVSPARMSCSRVEMSA